jgi:hypothetical protein
VNFNVEATVTLFRLRIKVFYRCCYIFITVDFATAALIMICITQHMCHIIILFHDCSMIKYESNKKSKFLSFSE